MKSLICPIEGNEKDIERALNEAEAFAKLEGLNDSQTNVIRLLSDEMLGMTGGILLTQNGRFWIEKVESDYILNLALETEVGTRAKAIFDSTSSNAEYKGISGLIKKATDSLAQMFEFSSGSASDFSTPMADGIQMMDEGAYEWALSKYEESCERDEKAERYDELEIPVIKKFSKDIKISYRNKRVDIKVIANI